MNLNKVKISPSIIAGDLSRMGDIIKDFDPAIVDLLHMDVMDGHFVPNLTFGPGYIADLKKHTDIPVDIHLMISEPEKSIDAYLDLDPWCAVIHYESTNFPSRLLSRIRERGVKAGLSINPATPVEAIFDIIDFCDMVLIMSVDPGFYGQSFMPVAFDRISKVRDLRSDKGLDSLLIQVDGGITEGNISQVVSSGADIIVAGSAAFKGGNVNSRVSLLKEAAGR